MLTHGFCFTALEIKREAADDVTSTAANSNMADTASTGVYGATGNAASTSSSSAPGNGDGGGDSMADLLGRRLGEAGGGNSGSNGEMSVTLSLKSSSNIGGVISAIADLLKIAVPPTYEVQNSPAPPSPPPNNAQQLFNSTFDGAATCELKLHTSNSIL